MLRSGLWTAGLAGRAHLAVQALQGQQVGPAGAVLCAIGGGLSALDGARQAIGAVRGTAPEGRLKASVGALGKLASSAGVATGLAGIGWPAGALVLGGLALSTAASY